MNRAVSIHDRLMENYEGVRLRYSTGDQESREQTRHLSVVATARLDAHRIMDDWMQAPDGGVIKQ